MRRFCVLILACIVGCGDDEPRLDGADTTPPGTIQVLEIEVTGDESVRLNWAAPGDDEYVGQAETYDVRMSTQLITEASWEGAVQTSKSPIPQVSGGSESLAIEGLNAGRWFFAVKTADEAENWSSLSDVAAATLGDTIPPAPILNLLVASIDTSSVTLTWTATGDDENDGRAAEYDLRLATFPINAENWDEATRVVSIASPDSAGATESFTVIDLELSVTYYFSLRVADRGGNLSVPSNLVSATPVPDTFPPSTVQDLLVDFAVGHAVTLRWTAPGNNGTNGRAERYDVRFSPDPISDGSWDLATQASQVSAPRPAGSVESFVVTGLGLEQQYFFALRTVDPAGNWSALSNVVMARPAALVQLTSSPRQAGAFRPRWSPDGRHIAFQADWEVSFQYQVYLMPATGGNPIALTNAPYGAQAPSWSPDGSRLACSLVRQSPSGFVTDLATMDAEVGAPLTVVASLGDDSIVASSWSPDGQEIAFAVRTAMPSGTREIRIVSAEGGESRLLVTDDSGISGLDWSPDGSRIAFASSRSGNRDIWTVSASDGSDPVQMTDDPGADSSPSWSPDGNRLAFDSNRAGGADIWVMASDGGNQTRLTFSPVEEGTADWAPGVAAVTFVSFADLVGDVWVLHLE